jgi:predicted nucleic acid-binding protein
VNFYFLEATAFAKLFVQEAGSEALIALLEPVEDNRKLIAASTPLEVYTAIRRRERAGDIAEKAAAQALDSLRSESARTVQQPLNPAVLESALQLIDRARLHWPDALQLGAAEAARDMFQSTEIVFVSASERLRKAAGAEGFKTIDPVKDLDAPEKKSEPVADTEAKPLAEE